MKKMKKSLALLTALLLALPVLAAAAAPTANPLSAMVDSVTTLLFATNNVTLEGTAVFSLDGERFKTVEAKYIQDGNRSFWKYGLKTPRVSGEDKISGYTVIANGEAVYVMEEYFPGVYTTGLTAAQNTILRRSVQLDLLTNIVRDLAATVYSIPGDISVTSFTGEENTVITIHMGEAVPESLNLTLSLFAQYLARRYFLTDYDLISNKTMAPMDQYLTVTEGLLANMTGLKVSKADLTLTSDSQGRFSSLSADVTLKVSTGFDGDRALHVTMDLSASDFGSSSVDLFDPDQYKVILRQDTTDFSVYADSTVIPAHDFREFPEDPEAWEKQIWTLAGYNPDETMYSDRFNCYFLEDGTLGEIQELSAPWLNMLVDDTIDVTWYEEDEPVANEKTLKWLTDFLSTVNPGMGVGMIYRQAWTCVIDGETYTQYEGYFPDDPAGHKGVVCFVVKESVPCIQYFSCISNG